MITTVLGEDPEERLPQPMIPRPTFTADIPSIREVDEINLSESLDMLKLKEVQPTEECHGSSPVAGTSLLQAREAPQLHFFQGSSSFPSVLKNQERDLILLMKHGYQPFRGLGKNEDGMIEPIVPARHVDSTGLGFTGQSSGRKTTFIKGAE